MNHTAADGEVHRADIKTATGIVIEAQHSNINDAERLSRELFYRNMIWIIDGHCFRKQFELHHKLPAPESELAQDLVWSRAGIGMNGANQGIFVRVSETHKTEPLTTRANLRSGQLHSLREVEDKLRHVYRGHHQYVWVRPRKTWFDATCPVYLDFGESWLARLETYDDTGLPCVFLVSKDKLVHDAMTEADARKIASRFYPF